MLNEIVGIDPGKKGAVANILIEDGKIVYASAMPMPNDIIEMVDILDGIDTVYIEKAQAMPRQGIVSAFTYAKEYGIILGIMMAYGINIVEVSPATWKRQMELRPSDDKKVRKENAMRMANMLVGHCMREPIKNDGEAEALLIALWGYFYGSRNKENQ